MRACGFALPVGEYNQPARNRTIHRPEADGGSSCGPHASNTCDWSDGGVSETRISIYRHVHKLRIIGYVLEVISGLVNLCQKLAWE
jgi:hypothetical protein